MTVLGLYVEGKRTKQVASASGIAPAMIDVHLGNARHKLGLAHAMPQSQNLLRFCGGNKTHKSWRI
tara:strand:+ start:96 stop:293 length:198 start_codon:yes stop_codon:yes gene_type:complete